MDNYKVKAIINFDDVQAGVKREAGKSEWKCSKERYLFLKEHNAVELIEIEKVELPKTEELIKVVEIKEPETVKTVKTTSKKKTSKKK